MRFVGIDIGAEQHVVAAVDARGRGGQAHADRRGCHGLQAVARAAEPVRGQLVVMEATGHYWKNVAAMLLAEGIAVAVINPLRTQRFAGEDLQRTKTDALDALGLARFGQQKRPTPTRLPDPATESLRESFRFRDRLKQDFDDRVRQLHRLVDLGFPEFTRYVPDLDTMRATALLRDYPTAAAFHGVAVHRLAGLRYDGQHKVGDALAAPLLAAGAHLGGSPSRPRLRAPGPGDLRGPGPLRPRLRELEGDIERLLQDHAVGPLLTSIDGIGTHTAARLIAELGDRPSSTVPAPWRPTWAWSPVCASRASASLVALR